MTMALTRQSKLQVTCISGSCVYISIAVNTSHTFQTWELEQFQTPSVLQGHSISLILVQFNRRYATLISFNCCIESKVMSPFCTVDDASLLNGILVDLRSSWQDFKCKTALRGASVTAELLVNIIAKQDYNFFSVIKNITVFGLVCFQTPVWMLLKLSVQTSLFNLKTLGVGRPLAVLLRHAFETSSFAESSRWVCEYPACFSADENSNTHNIVRHLNRSRSDFFSKSLQALYFPRWRHFLLQIR